MAFPDDRRIVGFGPGFRCMRKWCVPGPGICSGYAYPPFQQPFRRRSSEAAAAGKIVAMAVAAASRGVDQDDVESSQFMPDTAQFTLYILGRGDISVGKVAEVELHAGCEAPFQGYFIDSNGSGSAIHRRMVVVWGIEMRAVVRPERQFLYRPALLARQVFDRQTRKKRGYLVCCLAVPEIFNLRQHERWIGRKSGLERYGEINELRHKEWVSWCKGENTGGNAGKSYQQAYSKQHRQREGKRAGKYLAQAN
ncbi:protein of unknown function (plasmid) [Shinella sp. WSC3-e]|nr:protein of unknown function [Shinella sp. WSC3-e]